MNQEKVYFCEREGCKNSRKKNRKYCSRECSNIEKRKYRHTEEAKLSMIKNRTGKKHTQEWCDNISKGLRNSGNTTKGRKRPKEEIDRIRRSLVGSGVGKYERTPEVLAKMVESQKKNGYKFFNTKPELEVKELFQKYRINYIHQKKIENFMFDFFLTDFNLLIEIDGVYHHGKIKGKNNKYSELQLKIRRRDRKKNGIAKKERYNLKRVWSDEIQGFEKWLLDSLVNEKTMSSSKSDNWNFH
jgi:very-short-patch-repair endonuclease